MAPSRLTTTPSLHYIQLLFIFFSFGHINRSILSINRGILPEKNIDKPLLSSKIAVNRCYIVCSGAFLYCFILHVIFHAQANPAGKLNGLSAKNLENDTLSSNILK
jgi:hypothetical protein